MLKIRILKSFSYLTNCEAADNSAACDWSVDHWDSFTQLHLKSTAMNQIVWAYN